MKTEVWPDLPLDEWKDTYATLHLWLQMVGKVRLKLSPFVNHWWETALYLSPRGLRTSLIPHGTRLFELEFDFLDQLLLLKTGEGHVRCMTLSPKSTAKFYQEFMALLDSLGLHCAIDLEPKELPPPVIPFDQDEVHRSYDGEYAWRCSRIFAQAGRVLERFRGGFLGKSSPVHFFWGSFDLALTRFSGRTAPERPGADHITRVAYSHECMSVGFWPGSGNVREPAFYAYAAPEPEGFAKTQILPGIAYYNPLTAGFILPYAAVRDSRDPDGVILDFCQSAYDAAAVRGHWDLALERGLERKAA